MVRLSMELKYMTLSLPIAISKIRHRVFKLCLMVEEDTRYETPAQSKAKVL